MQKVWIYQRKNVPGWWVGWYSNGKRKAKAFPNKARAVRHARSLENQLNAGLYHEVTKVAWDSIVGEFLDHKKEVSGCVRSTVEAYQRSTARFNEICQPKNSTSFNQEMIYLFVKNRRQKSSNATINKDLRHLRVFVNWAQKKYYIKLKPNFEWPMQKVKENPVEFLTLNEVNQLLAAAKEHSDDWYILILLAITTGLRWMDIKKLRPSDFNLAAGTVNAVAQKTGKSIQNFPLHHIALGVLKKYLPGRDDLFSSRCHYTTWHVIRKRAGIRYFRFHWLRSTFASLLAQAGFSTAVTQNLLQHSTPALTHNVYTNVEPVYRKAIESIRLLPDDHQAS
jgi:integrase